MHYTNEPGQDAVSLIPSDKLLVSTVALVFMSCRTHQGTFVPIKLSNVRAIFLYTIPCLSGFAISNFFDKSGKMDRIFRVYFPRFLAGRPPVSLRGGRLLS